jgi:hypothetical protein
VILYRLKSPGFGPHTKAPTYHPMTKFPSASGCWRSIARFVVVYCSGVAGVEGYRLVTIYLRGWVRSLLSTYTQIIQTLVTGQLLRVVSKFYNLARTLIRSWVRSLFTAARVFGGLGVVLAVLAFYQGRCSLKTCTKTKVLICRRMSRGGAIRPGFTRFSLLLVNSPGGYIYKALRLS